MKAGKTEKTCNLEEKEKYCAEGELCEAEEQSVQERQIMIVVPKPG